MFATEDDQFRRPRSVWNRLDAHPNDVRLKSLYVVAFFALYILHIVVLRGFFDLTFVQYAAVIVTEAVVAAVETGIRRLFWGMSA